MAGFYQATPNETHAYAIDSGNEYYGWAGKGTNTSDSNWQIIKLEYTGSNWVEKYPNCSDQPIFKWDDVLTYTYYILGTRG